MEGAVGPVAQHIAAVFWQLLFSLSESVVNRRGTEQSYGAALALGVFEVEALQNDTQALDKENAAENGEQQLLVDDDGTHADDAANGQRTRIAHEDLGRERIVP